MLLLLILLFLWLLLLLSLTNDIATKKYIKSKERTIHITIANNNDPLLRLLLLVLLVLLNLFLLRSFEDVVFLDEDGDDVAPCGSFRCRKAPVVIMWNYSTPIRATCTIYPQQSLVGLPNNDVRGVEVRMVVQFLLCLIDIKKKSRQTTTKNLENF